MHGVVACLERQLDGQSDPVFIPVHLQGYLYLAVDSFLSVLGLLVGRRVVRM